MEKGGGNTVVVGAVAPCPPAPCLGNWGNADLRCHCPEPCTGLHWILQNRMLCKDIFRYVIVLYGNLFVFSLLHCKLLWVHSKTRRISLVYNLWCVLENWGKLCQQEPDVHQQDPHLWRNLNPSCPRGCWLVQVLQTNSDSFDPNGRHNNPLIPAKSDQWLG